MNQKFRYHMKRAAHFRALADPETNHLRATAHSSMLPKKAVQRMLYHEKRAAEELAAWTRKRQGKNSPGG